MIEEICRNLYGGFSIFLITTQHNICDMEKLNYGRNIKPGTVKDHSFSLVNVVIHLLINSLFY